MFVNGKMISLEEIPSKNLLGLVNFLSLNPGAVAIERNGEIVSRDVWETMELETSDRIEIIKFVGGG